MVFALIGNQNSGKTTLFNAITGANQHVGNFPGVTVEEKVGVIKNTKGCFVVDLPGIYSIRPYFSEEIITRDFLLSKNLDGIINIIDASNIERNLYLTLQLLELNIPMVIVLNMMDEVRSNGGSININKLSIKLGVPIIPISAIKNEGISEVINSIISVSNSGTLPKNSTFYSAFPIKNAIDKIINIIKEDAVKLNISPVFCATKIIEGDNYFAKLLKLKLKDIKLIENIVSEMENEINLDRNTAIAYNRYNFIEKICDELVKKPKESKQHKISSNIDKILTNKYLGLPMFFIIMFFIFYFTFNLLGRELSDFFVNGIRYLTNFTDILLSKYNVNSILHKLVIDGIFSGVGSVLSFLPLIIILFFFLSILEDTGYMARVTFIMDKLLRKIGLSGKSFVPMLIGFGCSVPAIMASRTLASKRDRRITMMLIPYMSCSAKLPIYAVFCNLFFYEYAAFAMIGLYIIGIIVGIGVGLLIKRFTFFEEEVHFIIELPNYRFPSIKNTLLLMWSKIKEFLEKAFSIIFIGTIIIWFFQTFDANFNIVNDNSNSILSSISKFLTPLFMPIGLGDFRIVTALISGLTAKEAVISTLSILLNTNIFELNYILPSIFSPLSACCFLIFTLLYPPCIGAIATMNKELNSPIQTFFIILFQLIVAFSITFIFYSIGLIIT